MSKYDGKIRFCNRDIALIDQTFHKMVEDRRSHVYLIVQLVADVKGEADSGIYGFQRVWLRRAAHLTCSDTFFLHRPPRNG